MTLPRHRPRRPRRAASPSRCVLALALGIAGAFPAPGSTGESALPPGYVMTTLPNGLRVSILPAPSDPIVATQIWYHVGSANEEPNTRGFAHLFEHMMFTG